MNEFTFSVLHSHFLLSFSLLLTLTVNHLQTWTVNFFEAFLDETCSNT